MEDRYGFVLLVEDDPDIAELVETALTTARFKVQRAHDGPSGLEQARNSALDAVVMDVNLPGMDGLSVCRELRKTSEVPILMLSALGEDLDKILGLEMGADDYLSKPFNPRELLARVRALVRRSRSRGSPAAAVETWSFTDLEIQVEARAVKLDGTDVHLTATEFSLLQALAARPGHVLSRQALLDSVWGQDWIGDDRTVDVHLRRLRAKLKGNLQHDYIPAVRGVGYKFDPPA